MFAMPDAQGPLDFMRSILPPGDDLAWQNAASDQEDDAGGQRPAFTRERVGDVDDMLGQGGCSVGFLLLL